MAFELTELGNRIFLDRYALKDGLRETLQLGSTVVVKYGGNTEIGTVTEINGNNLTVLIDVLGVKEVFDKYTVDVLLETKIEHAAMRMARAVAEAEPWDRNEWAKKFYNLLDDFKFVPAGRNWAGLGSNINLSTYNCYVLNSPEDSRGGILKTLGEMVELHSRGGGVGVNLSSLRPRDAYVKGVNGRSSGAVSWGELYSFTTGLIEQGGCVHPDTLIFTDKGAITAKELAGRLESGEAICAATHKGYKEFTRVFRNGIKKVVEVETERGYKTRISLDHKVAFLNNGEIDTKPIKDFKRYEELLLLINDNKICVNYVELKNINQGRRLGSSICKFPKLLTEEVAYVLGYFYANGNIIKRKNKSGGSTRVVICVPHSRPEIQNRLVEFIPKAFGRIPNISHADGKCNNIVIYSENLVDWLSANDLYKGKAKKLEVPTEHIFKSPNSVQAAFFAGWFDADGSDRKAKGGYGIDSICKEAVEFLQKLLAYNGIPSRINKTDRSKYGWNDIYRINITSSVFKNKLSNWMESWSLKDTLSKSKRNLITYPKEVWKQLGIPAKYYNGIWDSCSERISYGALTKIGNNLLVKGEVKLSVLPDRILDIRHVGRSEVLDFEVKDTHMLCGDAIYSHNSRRGATMLTLNVWHPDIIEFIGHKRDMKRTTNANISVGLTDAFMEAVKGDKDWDLVFPDTTHELYKTWRGILHEYDGPLIVYKTVKAREVWNHIVDSAWASAEPGLWFIDRANYWSNSFYYKNGYLIGQNPCIPENSTLLTPFGIRQLKDIDIGSVIWSGTKWTTVLDKVCRGVKQVYAYHTRGGVFYGTENHSISSKGVKTPVSEAETIDLASFDWPLDITIDAEDVMSGLLIGDGTAKDKKYVLLIVGCNDKDYFNDEVGKFIKGVFEIKGDIVSYRVDNNVVKAKDLVYTYNREIPDYYRFGTPSQIAGFLRGLYSANGSVIKNVRISLKASSFNVIKQTQEMLSSLGIHSYYTVNKPSTVKHSNGDYISKQSYDLNIGSLDGKLKFQKYIGFIQKYKQEALYALCAKALSGSGRSKSSFEIVKIDDIGEEFVYDILVDDEKHTFWCGGLLIYNCSEQNLPGNSVCNLAHINLSKFVKGVSVDWIGLEKTIKLAVRFLDNVVSSANYFLPGNKFQQENERRIGLGTLGLAEMLIKLNLKYGSEEGNKFVDNLYRFIMEQTFYASSYLAEEKGAFPWYSSKMLDSNFIKQLSPELRQKISLCGLRNVCLLTQAPTGTVGTMTNTSTGIEPYYFWEWRRNGRFGTVIEKAKPYEEWLSKQGKEYIESLDKGEIKLPDYFVNAMDLTPEEHVKVMAIIQKYTTSSISKTVNCPSDWTVEQVAELYMIMYDLGCKGGTIYRDKSRNLQVLELLPDENKKQEPSNIQESNLVPAPKIRPKLNFRKGDTISKSTPFGTAHITMNDDPEGNPMEVFIEIGKAGSDIKAIAEGFGRLISLMLRINCHMTPKEVMEVIIHQLEDIGGLNVTGFGRNQIKSLPDALAKALKTKYMPTQEVSNNTESAMVTVSGIDQDNNKITETVSFDVNADLCPSCGNASLIRQEGCQKCFECGFSKCG